MLKKYFIFLIPVLLAGCVLGQAPDSKKPVQSISSFEDCVAAGNAVMESYPRQCRTSAGTLFVEQVPPIKDDETICTAQYDPVCGLVQVQCIKAPCPPLWSDYSNDCFARGAGATEIRKGTCEDLGLTN